MPLFDAAYAACPIWPSKAATDAVLMITPRSPLAPRRIILHRCRRQTQNVEGADKIDADNLAKIGQRKRPIFADDLSGRGNTGTVDGDADIACEFDGSIYRRLHRIFVRDIGLNERDLRTQSFGQRYAGFGVEVSDNNLRPRAVQQFDAGSAKP